MAVGQRSEKNVSSFPDYAKAGFAKSLLRTFNRTGCDVKDCDTGKATLNEIINKRRLTTADVKKFAVFADAGP